MVLASTRGKVATNTLVTLIPQLKRKALAATHGHQMALNTRASGKVTKKLASDATYILTKVFILASITRKDQTGSEFIDGRTEIHTKENGKMVFAAASENSNSPNKTHSTSVSLNKTNLMARVTSNILTAHRTKDFSELISDTDSARVFGQTEASTSVSGKMARKTDLAVW